VPRRLVIRRKQQPLVSATIPHSTRATRPKVPCLRIAYREEQTHRAVILQSIEFNPIIWALYLKRCDFYDTSILLGITSKKVGKMRYKLLTSIDSVL
jgi:hypothetical protein